LFTETPDGVIFHNADGGFQVTSPSAYRFATLLVPHLDGSRTVAEICTGFKDPQKAMVGGLVKALYARGFARSVPDPAAPDAGGTLLEPAVADLFAEQIAYLDHYADGARRAFAAFRGTRVAVLGDGQTARWAALSLIRNGCAAVGVEAALAEGPATARDVDAVRAEAARYPAGRLGGVRGVRRGDRRLRARRLPDRGGPAARGRPAGPDAAARLDVREPCRGGPGRRPGRGGLRRLRGAAARRERGRGGRRG